MLNLKNLSLAELQKLFVEVSQRLEKLEKIGQTFDLKNRRLVNTGTAILDSDGIRKDQVFLLTNLANIILGTSDEVTVTDNLDETVTVSLPSSIILSGLTASRLMASDSNKKTASVSDLTNWITGTNNEIVSTSNGTGGVVLSLVEKTGYVANSVTLVAGTTVDSLVADLQNHDAVNYHIDEVNATPGIDLIVDFVSVTFFNFVNIICNYSGALTTHSISLQLYNWIIEDWVIFNSCTPNQQTSVDHSFFVHDCTEFIGTGANAGKTRVRFNHTQNGTITHDLDIDVVKLFNRT